VPQLTLLKIVFESGYILCVSTAPPLVTFSMARYEGLLLNGLLDMLADHARFDFSQHCQNLSV